MEFWISDWISADSVLDFFRGGPLDKYRSLGTRPRQATRIVSCYYKTTVLAFAGVRCISISLRGSHPLPTRHIRQPAHFSLPYFRFPTSVRFLFQRFHGYYSYRTGLETDHVIPHYAVVYTSSDHSFGPCVTIYAFWCEKRLAAAQEEAKQSLSESYSKRMQPLCVCSVLLRSPCSSFVPC